MKKFICSTLLALCCGFAQSETVSLDSFLHKQDYYQFETHFNKLLTTPEERKSYLFQYIHSGHAIVYWLMANEFSKEVLSSNYLVEDKKLLDFTKTMIYTALLITEQDSNVCMDREPANAARKLLSQYSAIMGFERKYFGNNEQIMQKSISFLDNLKNRPEPMWVCLQYGNRMNIATYGKTYNVNEFQTLRKAANAKLLKSVTR